MSLAAHVRKYNRKFAPHLEAELAYYRNLKSIEEVIRRATVAVGEDEKMHPHQRRLGYDLLERQAERFLQHRRKIRFCEIFDDLMDVLNRYSLKGVGALALYDTALRIGAWLNVYPSVVYLHTGTLRGFRNLGLTASGGVATVDVFPKPVRALEPHHIEDFLCIFKDHILANGNSASPCGTRFRKRNGC